MKKRKTVSAAAGIMTAVMLMQTVAAAPTIDIYDPISISREVTFVAGEAEGSYEGESHTEGTSNVENTMASQNSKVSKKLTQKRQKLIKETEIDGDLLMRGDTFIVSTNTVYVDTYDLVDYVLEAQGYEKVNGLLPIQKHKRSVELEAMTAKYNELVAIGQKIYEELLIVDNLEDIDWESLGLEDYNEFLEMVNELYDGYNSPPLVTTNADDGVVRPSGNIPEAIEKLMDKIEEGGSGLRPEGVGLPSTIIPVGLGGTGGGSGGTGGTGNPGGGTPGSGGTGGTPGGTGGGPYNESCLYELPGLDKLPQMTPPELPLLEIPTLRGEIEEIEMELERILGYILNEQYEYWDESILHEWEIPYVDIINGTIKVNTGAVGLEYERTDIIPGGILDTRSLESRFRLLDIYLNHIAMTDVINTRTVTEYRVTGETQSKVVEKIPTNTWVWTVEDAAGNVVAGPIYTQGRYLRFIFGAAGTYRIRAKQVMNVVRADVVTYDKNEYWVLNNGDAFDGLVIYRDHKKGMSYRTNVTQSLEEVPVSDIWQDVTEDMVGFAFVAGPNTGLVGVRPEFNTQRYK